MVVTSSRLAYSDCYDLMELAIADEKGIQVKFDKYDDAFHFRLRLHTARRIDRTDNKVLYSEEHPMWGRSIYDPLSMKIKRFPGGAWLRIERVDKREFEWQSLSEPLDEPELSFEHPVIINSPKPLKRRM